MIIHGTTSMNSTLGTGTFHCPRCSLPRGYVHIGVNRYWTLYFIPLIPLGQRGSYVECQQCTGTFGPEVLNYQPDPAEQKRFVEETSKKMWTDLRRCLILLLYHAQRNDSASQQRIRTLCEEGAQQPLSMEVVAQEWKQAEEAQAQLAPVAHHMFGKLPEKERLFVLQAGRNVLAGNAGLSDRDRSVLRQLGAGLALPPQVVESL